ncbi:hypothetical protein BV210_11950 [Halorientalis sp. IM1011]|uniref:hypothetical protein n=1 Tax=Halorientalis sp. IM1011 TaxID=1932360 RepID=UPI00097CC771|nr:hypothetical protein [Halorientalis sp. IM1011]AQL43359.1 hypothetical protein BV210_11950 [Halorientalis sp. IM1011]
MTGDPIEGDVLVLVAAKASVGPQRLPELVDRVAADLDSRRDAYAREYELAYETDERTAFFVEDGHWEEIGGRLDLGTREIDAVRRSHEEQMTRDGRRLNRTDEFETALEIRDCVVVRT